jgi:hypothetical protein
MLSITDFLRFAYSHEFDEPIDNDSWETCAVGSYFKSYGVKLNKRGGYLEDIVDPNYKRTVRIFQDDMEALIVDSNLLSGEGRNLGQEGHDPNNLYMALNNSVIDDYGQLVEVIQDAIQNADMYNQMVAEGNNS